MKSFLLVIIVAVAGPLCQAASILISPESLTVATGASFEVVVLASDFGVGAFDLDISFDPTVIAVSSVAFDGSLGAPLSLPDWMPGSGVVSLSEVSFLDPGSLVPLQVGRYSLGRLSFSAIGPGISTLVISRSVVSDPEGTVIFPLLQSAAVTVEGVTTTPEPSTVLPALAALLGMLRIRFSRRVLSRTSH